MMHDIRLHAPVKRAKLAHRCELTQRVLARATHVDRMQLQARILDKLCMRLDPRRDDHAKTRCLRGARQRQTVRAEVPILGYEKQQLGLSFHER